MLGKLDVIIEMKEEEEEERRGGNGKLKAKGFRKLGRGAEDHEEKSFCIR